MTKMDPNATERPKQEVLPKGLYPMAIENAEWVEKKNKPGEYQYSVRFTTFTPEGKNTNMRFFNDPTNAKSQYRLWHLFESVGLSINHHPIPAIRNVPEDPYDINEGAVCIQLMDRVCLVEVYVGKDLQGEPQNAIADFKPYLLPDGSMASQPPLRANVPSQAEQQRSIDAVGNPDNDVRIA